MKIEENKTEKEEKRKDEINEMRKTRGYENGGGGVRGEFNHKENNMKRKKK